MEVNESSQSQVTDALYEKIIQHEEPSENITFGYPPPLPDRNNPGEQIKIQWTRWRYDQSYWSDRNPSTITETSPPLKPVSDWLVAYQGPAVYTFSGISISTFPESNSSSGLVDGIAISHTSYNSGLSSYRYTAQSGSFSLPRNWYAGGASAVTYSNGGGYRRKNQAYEKIFVAVNDVIINPGFPHEDGGNGNGEEPPPPPPPCDIAITSDFDEGYFCMTFSEYQRLIGDIKNIEQNLDAVQ